MSVKWMPAAYMVMDWKGTNALYPVPVAVQLPITPTGREVPVIVESGEIRLANIDDLSLLKMGTDDEATKYWWVVVNYAAKNIEGTE